MRSSGICIRTEPNEFPSFIISDVEPEDILGKNESEADASSGLSHRYEHVGRNARRYLLMTSLR